MPNNNQESRENSNRQPTISDVIALLEKVPTRDDLSDMKQSLVAITNQNKEKIEAVEQQVESISSVANTNTDRISVLEHTIHMLQQDKLKNNVCISGVPLDEQIKATEAVVKIAEFFQIQIAEYDFSAYATANNKFIIATFHNFGTKQSLLNKIRSKRSLMVEEVFGTLRSNSQIYINEHLTRYFNNLYLMARVAKKQGKLASALSSSGKIRVRKHADDVPIIITDEYQLKTLIEMEMEMDTQTSNNQQDQPNAGNSRTRSHKPSTSTANRGDKPQGQFKPKNLKRRPEDNISPPHKLNKNHKPSKP